jgi:hypothetical protein
MWKKTWLYTALPDTAYSGYSFLSHWATSPGTVFFQPGFDPIPHLTGHFQAPTLIPPGLKVFCFGNDRVVHPIVHALL